MLRLCFVGRAVAGYVWQDNIRAAGASGDRVDEGGKPKPSIPAPRRAYKFLSGWWLES